MLKSHFAGDLRLSDVGTNVELAGWVQRRRDHGGLIFVDLRDSRGMVAGRLQRRSGRRMPTRSRTRCAANTSSGCVAKSWPARRRHGQSANAHRAKSRCTRPKLEILNAAQTPPFYISDETDVDELSAPAATATSICAARACTTISSSGTRS